MAVTPDEAAAIALALPDAVEADHHGKRSFRVAGKIFATLWSDTQINVMLDEPGILTAIDALPSACRPVMWGKRLAAAGVDLTQIDAVALAALLADAREGKAG